jgi:hypothetical protein
VCVYVYFCDCAYSCSMVTSIVKLALDSKIEVLCIGARATAGDHSQYSVCVTMAAQCKAVQSAAAVCSLLQTAAAQLQLTSFSAAAGALAAPAMHNGAA